MSTTQKGSAGHKAVPKDVDTSGMFDKNISSEKLKSLEFAEQQRETEWQYPSFVLKLFHGIIDWNLIHPFPDQSPDDKKKGDEFIAKLMKILTEKLDPDQVDRTGQIPNEVVKALAEIGAFAIKIPEKYGGLGLSQMNYNRAVHCVGSYCGSTCVLLTAHQSIGVPQPLKLFGTEEQKQKYFPMFAKGMISAFALTEPEAGSDPRNMSTTATPTEDGKHFLINGEKLWCTNGLVAGVIVVMAVTPPKIVNGKEKKQITAFIVETNTPGIEVVHRCRFMGLSGIQNGLMKFTNVKVPRENILFKEGEGLRLALTTLNTGRLTMPAGSTGIAKWCLNISRRWAKERIQWGGPIGEHESIGLKVGRMATTTFAMEAITWLSSMMADDKNRDIRLEAAIAKYFCTEASWKIIDDTMQIRGGSGYETASSLKARGAKPWPVERVMRDIRINLIIEGTSEIMHLFIAREALDPHLSKLKPLLSSRTSLGEKMKALGTMMKYYMFWYPKLWLPSLGGSKTGDMPGALAGHARYVESTAKRLARYIFHRMIMYQQRMEAKQSVLNRIVDIGTDLFVMASVCSYASALQKKQETANSIELAELFCREARARIEENFSDGPAALDRRRVVLSKKVIDGQYEWLETEIIKS